MSKKLKSKLKFIPSVTTVSLISIAVIGTNQTEASANPFSKLWSRFKGIANNLTLSNPFGTSKSVNLNMPSSKGKISSPTTPLTSWQNFKANFGEGSDAIINSSQLTTSNNEAKGRNLWTKFKDLLVNNNSTSYKIKTSGKTNPTFELENVSSTTSEETKRQRMLESLYGEDSKIFTSTNENKTETNIGGEERKQKLLSSLYGEDSIIFTSTNNENNKERQRKRLLENLYVDDSKLFVTGNIGDIDNNKNHFTRLNDSDNKTHTPLPIKQPQITVQALIHSNDNSSSSSNNKTSISSSSTKIK